MTEKNKIRVLFVCTGNICRSPMAEAVFIHLVNQAGLADQFEIASAGTGSWHVGERPHRGTQAVLQSHHVPLSPNKQARQLVSKDFADYHYIIAMDGENIADMSHYTIRHGKRVPRLLEFAPAGVPLDVPDPYYTGNFDGVYNLVLQGCQGLLDHIRKQEGV